MSVLDLLDRPGVTPITGSTGLATGPRRPPVPRQEGECLGGKTQRQGKETVESTHLGSGTLPAPHPPFPGAVFRPYPVQSVQRYKNITPNPWSLEVYVLNTLYSPFGSGTTRLPDRRTQRITTGDPGGRRTQISFSCTRNPVLCPFSAVKMILHDSSVYAVCAVFHEIPFRFARPLPRTAVSFTPLPSRRRAPQRRPPVLCVLYVYLRFTYVYWTGALGALRSRSVAWAGPPTRPPRAGDGRCVPPPGPGPVRGATPARAPSPAPAAGFLAGGGVEGWRGGGGVGG